MRKSPFSVDFWIEKGVSEEDAQYKVKSFRPTNIEYWLSKGFSEEEAKIKLIDHQKNSCKTLNKKRKENPHMIVTNIEYWLSKGFSEEEAKIKLKERQTTFSKEKCIEKYGEEKGLDRWNKRQKKWIKSLYDRSEEEIKQINNKKAITKDRMIEKYGKEDGVKKWRELNRIRSIKSKESFIERTLSNDKTKNFFSKESINFLTPIYNYCVKSGFKDTDIFWGLTNEWFIRDNENIFFYDFLIRPANIIIEYHGECFHPNPSLLTEQEWDDWRQLYTGFNAETCHKKDIYKKQLAEKNGFIYFEVFSQDSDLRTIERLIYEIENKISRN